MAALSANAAAAADDNDSGPDSGPVSNVTILNHIIKLREEVVTLPEDFAILIRAACSRPKAMKSPMKTKAVRTVRAALKASKAVKAMRATKKEPKPMRAMAMKAMKA